MIANTKIQIYMPKHYIASMVFTRTLDAHVNEFQQKVFSIAIFFTGPLIKMPCQNDLSMFRPNVIDPIPLLHSSSCSRVRW